MPGHNEVIESLEKETLRFEADFYDTADHYYGDFSVSEITGVNGNKEEYPEIFTRIMKEFAGKRVRVSIQVIGEGH